MGWIDSSSPNNWHPFTNVSINPSLETATSHNPYGLSVSYSFKDNSIGGVTIPSKIAIPESFVFKSTTSLTILFWSYKVTLIPVQDYYPYKFEFLKTLWT